jgi:nucleoside permease NupC
MSSGSDNEEDLIMHQETEALENMDPELALMAKLQNGMDDVRPTGAQIHKVIKYFDLGIKFEVTMYETRSILNNISSLEIFLFIFGMIFYLRLISALNNFWYFLPHFIRGICGLVLSKKLPKSHEMIKLMDFEGENGPIDFDSIH